MATQELKVRLVKDEGVLVAQCTANPAILVTGKTRKEVRKNLGICIAGYVKAFPESKRRFFAGGRMKKVAFVAKA